MSSLDSAPYSSRDGLGGTDQIAKAPSEVLLSIFQTG